MYRILASNDEVRERRNQLRHPHYAKPELVATRPNEVWSWDITKLKGPAKWVYYYLYVVLDIFSRYVVGWLLAQHENASLAQRLIRELPEAVWINRPEEATRQIAPGTTQTDRDDPEVVPVISTYGVLAPPDRIEAQLMSEAAAQ